MWCLQFRSDCVRSSANCRRFELIPAFNFFFGNFISAYSVKSMFEVAHVSSRTTHVCVWVCLIRKKRYFNCFSLECQLNENHPAWRDVASFFSSFRFFSFIKIYLFTKSSHWILAAQKHISFSVCRHFTWASARVYRNWNWNWNRVKVLLE